LNCAHVLFWIILQIQLSQSNFLIHLVKILNKILTQPSTTCNGCKQE
jgi:hypothetical protein